MTETCGRREKERERELERKASLSFFERIKSERERSKKAGGKRPAVHARPLAYYTNGRIKINLPLHLSRSLPPHSFSETKESSVQKRVRMFCLQA